MLGNISSFFDDHKDIRLCVHESLADFASKRELKGWVSADEVIDTRPLFEEIKKLSEENKNLRETIQQNAQRAPAIAKQSTNTEKFIELRNILKGIDIKIPASLADGNETTLSLLEIFYANKDTLINGVTNSANASPAESFFYHNVCPKLQVHGLVTNEKVPSVRYRRSFVSSEGNAFLAEMERVMHLADKKKKEADNKVEAEQSTAASQPQKPVVKKAAKKSVPK